MITSDGVIKKKNMPTDNYYQAVTIHESRKRNTQEVPTDQICNQDLNKAFIADEDNVSAINQTEIQTASNSLRYSKRIMTAAEIEAELNEDSDPYISDSE